MQDPGILFFTCWYPNKYNAYHGIFIKEHARAIKKTGASVTVLVINVLPSEKLYATETEDFIDENGIRTCILHIKSSCYKWIYANPVLIGRYLKSLYEKHIRNSEKIDIVHSNIIAPSGIAGYRLSVDLGLPHIITEHWSKADLFFKKNIFSKAGQKVYNKSKFVTFVSGFLENKLDHLIKDKNKVRIIPNVVDEDIFFYTEKKSSEIIRFCSAATWTLPKKPMLIAQSLEQLSSKSDKKMELYFVGGGQLLDEIKSKKWSYTIHYPGFLPKKQFGEILRGSDFFLHASETETFSLVTAEALATGLPVLASNKGALPELVNTGSGIIAENNIESWADGLRQLISGNWDRPQIAAGAFSRFSSKIAGNAFLALYNEVIK